MANIIGAVNGLRIAGEATASGATDLEGFLILWGLSVVVCLSLGVSIAKMLQPTPDRDAAPWIYGGISAIATILATMGSLMFWFLKH